MQKVIKLSGMRELLTEWEKVRHRILSGRITGFQAMLMDTEDGESLVLGGTYASDAQRSAKASLRMSAIRMMQEDEAPIFQAPALGKRRRQ